MPFTTKAELKLSEAETVKRNINNAERNRLLYMIRALKNDHDRLKVCIEDIEDLHKEMFAYSNSEQIQDKSSKSAKSTEFSAKVPSTATKSPENTNNDPCNDKKRQKLILRIPKSALFLPENMDEPFSPIEPQEYGNETNNNAEFSEQSGDDELWNPIKTPESSEDESRSGSSTETSSDDQCNVKINLKSSTDDQCNSEIKQKSSMDDQCNAEVMQPRSVDDQCNTGTMQECSVDGQWNIETMQQCSMDNQFNIETMQQCYVDHQCNIETMQQCSVDDQCNIETMQQCSEDGQCNIGPMQQCSVDDQCNIETMQQCSMNGQRNVQRMQQCSVDDQCNIEMQNSAVDLSYKLSRSVKSPEYSVELPFYINMPEYSVDVPYSSIKTPEDSTSESSNSIETQEHPMNENDIYQRDWFVAPITSDLSCNTKKEGCNIEIAKTRVSELLSERENEIFQLVRSLKKKFSGVQSMLQTVRIKVYSVNKYSDYYHHNIYSMLDDIGTTLSDLDRRVSRIHKKFAEILQDIS